MRQRHVTRRMVERTLADPDRPYRQGNIADEEVAERRFGQRVVEVVFEERTKGDIVLITVKARRAR